jgi:NadR type nicotinamide-nucleotide adenylyltransferase
MTWRISITGPESTGKSILAEELARHYNTVWVPEYSREYLENLHKPYEEIDILEIAKGQLDHEEKAVPGARKFLFCDTDLLVTKIWSDVRYNRCDPWILENVERHMYDLYLLCDIDIPWVYDPLREHPHLREHLFELYLNELTERNFPFAVVSGLGAERLKNAITIIENRFKS